MNDKDYLIERENLKSASEKVVKIHNSVSKMIMEMRTLSTEFYFRLSLLAGGVLSLSITYIGYLSSIPNKQLQFGEFLFLAWVFLLIAVIASLYRNHFNLDMGHYQVVNTLNQARLEEQEALLVILENYPQDVINLKTPSDVSKRIDATKKNILTIKKAIETMRKKEEQNSSLWLVAQKSAHISFILGLVLITIFAWINLPIPVQFSIINSFKIQSH